MWHLDDDVMISHVYLLLKMSDKTQNKILRELSKSLLPVEGHDFLVLWKKKKEGNIGWIIISKSLEECDDDLNSALCNAWKRWATYCYYDNYHHILLFGSTSDIFML